MLILDYDYEMDIAVQKEEAERIDEKRGIDQDIARGLQRGIDQETLKSAKNFKELGSNNRIISQITGLANEQIEVL